MVTLPPEAVKMTAIGAARHRMLEGLAADLDTARARARAAGVEAEFEAALRYEQARGRRTFERGLKPTEVLSVLLRAM